MRLHTPRWAVSSAALVIVTVACGSKPSNDLGGAGIGGSPADGDDGGGASGDNGGGSGGGPGGGFFSQGADAGGDSGSSAPIMVTSIDNCTTGAPSGLSSASEKALLAGGHAGSMRLLYPYSGTVFPRGLIAPTLMWDGASADYVYVHLKSKAFEYKGCLAPTAAGQLLLPQKIWEAASAHASGEADPFSLSLTTIASGTVTGPITQPLIIAPATLKGSIYYNSYSSQLGGGMGAVLRIVPGQNVTLFLGANGCTGCHAVSANGSRMVADPFLPGGAGDTYALTPQGAANPAPLVANTTNGTFVGLYPDGSLYVGNAHPNNGLGGPRSGGPGSIGPVSSGLFETDTGNAVANSGIPAGAMMPMFSPSGKDLTFVDTAIGNGNGQGIATMTFDKASRTATAYKKAYQVSDSSTYPGWPFYLPDEGGVAFAIGNQTDFTGGALGLGLAGAVSNATSDLYMLDLASGMATILAKAVGFNSPSDAASSKTYLPFAAADELHHNFYPTVSPVAAGGYFWLFFDSYRHYGNQGLERQLWGTAITVSSTGTYTTDASHPAFYLTGQESGTGNHRAFTALDPCKASGSACSQGEDCCGGFCTNGMCGLPPTCSNIDDACSATQKCCDPALRCIGGFCATIVK